MSAPLPAMPASPSFMPSQVTRCPITNSDVPRIRCPMFGAPGGRGDSVPISSRPSSRIASTGGGNTIDDSSTSDSASSTVSGSADHERGGKFSNLPIGTVRSKVPHSIARPGSNSKNLAPASTTSPRRFASPSASSTSNGGTSSASTGT